MKILPFASSAIMQPWQTPLRWCYFLFKMKKQGLKCFLKPFKASLLQLKSGKLEEILTKRSYLKVKSKQPYICLVLGFQTPRSKILLLIGYALEESRQTTKSWWATLWSSWSRPWPGKATRHQAGKARARSRPWTGSWQRYDIWQFFLSNCKS